MWYFFNILCIYFVIKHFYYFQTQLGNLHLFAPRASSTIRPGRSTTSLPQPQSPTTTATQVGFWLYISVYMCRTGIINKVSIWLKRRKRLNIVFFACLEVKFHSFLSFFGLLTQNFFESLIGATLIVPYLLIWTCFAPSTYYFHFSRFQLASQRLLLWKVQLVLETLR